MFQLLFVLCVVGSVSSNPLIQKIENELGVRLTVSQPLYHRYIGDITTYDVSFSRVISRSLQALQSSVLNLHNTFRDSLGQDLSNLLRSEMLGSMMFMTNYFEPTYRAHISRSKRSLSGMLKSDISRKTQKKLLQDAKIIIDSHKDGNTSSKPRPSEEHFRVEELTSHEQAIAGKNRFSGSLASVYHQLPLPSSFGVPNATHIEWGDSDEDVQDKIEGIERKARKVEDYLRTNNSEIIAVVKDIVKIYFKSGQVLRKVLNFVADLGNFPLNPQHLKALGIDSSPVAILEGVNCYKNFTCMLAVRSLPQIKYKDVPCFRATMVSLPLHYVDFDVYLVFSKTIEEFALCVQDDEVHIPYTFDQSIAVYQPFIVTALRSLLSHDKVKCLNYVLNNEDLPDSCSYIPFQRDDTIVAISDMLVLRTSQSVVCCSHTTDIATLEYFQFPLSIKHSTCNCIGHMIPTTNADFRDIKEFDHGITIHFPQADELIQHQDDPSKDSIIISIIAGCLTSLFITVMSHCIIKQAMMTRITKIIHDQVTNMQLID
ncbi:glycoprotein [Wenzhou Crab Virus 3]|uniref:Glycoprotein n=1 Tax=Wenzhou Crab Virus 3 TaxID=1608093 RepID=A0A0B5KJW9_9VIRU|nr:glycoprotein [Wenzhou Crab Virus 3]AJG39065.1 glycoprotein [Wenzhou Crab Virus 3]